MPGIDTWPGPLRRLLPARLLAPGAAFRGLCLSGAAPGADEHCSRVAERAGHAIVHWSFGGHRRAACAGHVVELAPDRLALGTEPVARAAAALSRKVPRPDSHALRLLCRDYFQVAWAERIYAVADRDADGEIAGGTAWTLAMFALENPAADGNAFLFDQSRCCWSVMEEGRWNRIAAPPSPAGVWAGIGSRSLAEAGRTAIDDLLGAAA